MSKCVAEFQRLATDDKGGDAKARIYEAVGGFALSYYSGTDCVMTSATYGSYDLALKSAIQWIDNSEFHQ